MNYEDLMMFAWFSFKRKSRRRLRSSTPHLSSNPGSFRISVGPLLRSHFGGAFVDLVGYAFSQSLQPVFVLRIFQFGYSHADPFSGSGTTFIIACRFGWRKTDFSNLPPRARVAIGTSWSLRGLNPYSGLTQDFVRTCVMDFVLGYYLPPLWGWGSGDC